jgi:hypothetical protein
MKIVDNILRQKLHQTSDLTGSEPATVALESKIIQEAIISDSSQGCAFTLKFKMRCDAMRMRNFFKIILQCDANAKKIVKFLRSFAKFCEMRNLQ